MGYFVFFGLPVILLIDGLPDLSHPAGDLDRRGDDRHHRHPDRRHPDLHVRQPRQFSAACRPILRAGRRDHGARRHRAAHHRHGHGHRRRRARLARGDDGRGLRTVRRDVAYRRRHRRCHGPHDLSVAEGGRLQRPLRRRPDRLVGRDRRRHSAVDRHDPLRGVGGAIGGAAVHRGHPAEHSHRRHRCRLCHDLCADKRRSARRHGALGDDLEDDQGCELVDRLARSDLRRHLWRGVHADRGRRRRRRLFAVRDHVHLPGSGSRPLLANPECVVSSSRRSC